MLIFQKKIYLNYTDIIVCGGFSEFHHYAYTSSATLGLVFTLFHPYTKFPFIEAYPDAEQAGFNPSSIERHSIVYIMPSFLSSSVCPRATDTPF